MPALDGGHERQVGDEEIDQAQLGHLHVRQDHHSHILVLGDRCVRVCVCVRAMSSRIAAQRKPRTAYLRSRDGGERERFVVNDRVLAEQGNAFLRVVNSHLECTCVSAHY